MKKKYIKPSMDVYLMSTPRILAGSNLDPTDQQDPILDLITS